MIDVQATANNPNPATVSLSPQIIWEAQPRQAAFISCPVDDIAFGGARGGGKPSGLSALNSASRKRCSCRSIIDSNIKRHPYKIYLTGCDLSQTGDHSSEWGQSCDRSYYSTFGRVTHQTGDLTIFDGRLATL
jgi:hypothetical protein